MQTAQIALYFDAEYNSIPLSELVPSVPVSDEGTLPNEDVGLVQRVAARDEQALAELYRQYSSVLYSFAVKMLNDTPEAEEVLQDTFLKAWKYAHTYQPQRGTVFTWLVTITRSKCLDRLRTRKINPLRGNRNQSIETTSTLIQPETGDNSTFRKNIGSEISDKLRELPDDQRECIELAYYKGYTQLEIASKLREPLGTIKARIRRGLLRMRAILPPL